MTQRKWYWSKSHIFQLVLCFGKIGEIFPKIVPGARASKVQSIHQLYSLLVSLKSTYSEQFQSTRNVLWRFPERKYRKKNKIFYTNESSMEFLSLKLSNFPKRTCLRSIETVCVHVQCMEHTATKQKQLILIQQDLTQHNECLPAQFKNKRNINPTNVRQPSWRNLHANRVFIRFFIYYDFLIEKKCLTLFNIICHQVISFGNIFRIQLISFSNKPWFSVLLIRWELEEMYTIPWNVENVLGIAKINYSQPNLNSSCGYNYDKTTWI